MHMFPFLNGPWNHTCYLLLHSSIFYSCYFCLQPVILHLVGVSSGGWQNFHSFCEPLMIFAWQCRTVKVTISWKLENKNKCSLKLKKFLLNFKENLNLKTVFKKFKWKKSKGHRRMQQLEKMIILWPLNFCLHWNSLIIGYNCTGNWKHSKTNMDLVHC